MTDLLKSMTAAAESIAMDEGKSETILPYLHIHLFSTTHVTIPEPGAPFLYMVLRGCLQFINANGIGECRQGQYFISRMLWTQNLCWRYQ
ncbi:hypothetical protein [Erwinia mallotivora]|uniref:hypothetical protein n=1 Tax=Erwinia mallotivora TaxID=69222 RepID=UPI0021C0B6F8|nr:hypothetical protein [Erwinia mallotivora]